MDYAYIFGDAQTLYLNVTNRCTNRCRFCVRYGRDGLGGSVLWGGEEPDLPLLQHAIQARGGLDGIREFVWCGFGEPTFRLDLIRQAEPWLRSRGAKIRLNTNGHACLIHGRDVLPELSGAADEVSISLNAPDCESYAELCRPESERLSWESLIDFLKRARLYFENTQASVVASMLTSEQIERCRSLAASYGIRRFLLR